MADETKKILNVTPWLIVTPVGGSREGVKAFVQEQKQNGMDGKSEGADQSCIEAAKVFILNRIDALPAEFNHVVVRADGRMTPQGEVVSIRVTGSTAL